MIAADAKPALGRGFRLQWEPAQKAHVLLYPEGMVKLIKHECLPLIGGILALCVLYFLAMRLTAPKTEKAAPAA